MGQRNPAPVDRWQPHPIILDGFQPSFWILFVVQDFATHSSMMFNAELLDTVVIPTQLGGSNFH